MDTSRAGSRLLFDNGRGDPPPAPRPVSAAPPAGPGTAVAASPIGLMMTGSSKMFLLQPDRQFFPSHPPPLAVQAAEGTAHGAYALSGQENRVGFQQWHAAGSGGGGNVVRGGGDAAVTDEDNDDGDEDCDDDEVGEDDDSEDGDGEVEGMGVGNGAREERLNSSTTAQSSSEKICHDKANSQEDQSSFGSSRCGLDKDGGNDNCQGSMSRQEPQQQKRMLQYENAITIAEPEIYYAQILQGGDIPSLSQKEAGGQGSECGFSGRKDGFFSSSALGESLRKHLSDPITGVLMDDAMILPCGHSYGSSGMQHIVRMKVCSKCDHPIPDNSFRPNLALRSVVQAFHREEEALYSKSSKRRRERFEQDKCNFNELLCVDLRGKGVQFPFAVSDRVIIKGNKRTPPRFVGRLAVVTGQCLNGWYVVKTLDNAESVKLQYRSLAKAPDDAGCTIMPSQATAPNWL